MGSGARQAEIADNLERQFNAIDTDMRESSMPGSGGYDADELSNVGGGLIGRAGTTFVVDMAASHQEFYNHVSESNKDFKEQIMKKVQMIQLKDTSSLNKQVSSL